MTGNTTNQFARLKMLVVSEPDGEGQTLLRHLQRLRAMVRQQWPAPDRIGENTDVLLCEYGPSLGKRLAWMPGEAEAALIVLLPQHGRFDVRELQAACPNAVLHRPYLPQAIDAALMIAVDHFNFARRLKLRMARMEENVRAMRDIEKAKQAIMLRDSVGEAEAFRILREAAMRKRVTVASIASKFVDSSDNLM